jgi:ubiquinone/menaquinone biosynthesis C-methylase UbiE
MNSGCHDDRKRKSEKIIAILHDYLQGTEKHLSCLDIGCSSGIISNQLAEYFSMVVGVDIEINKMPVMEIPPQKSGSALFSEASGQELPFPDRSFDVVICAQVYEHVSDQVGLATEIYRVIRTGGICFFSGPNRLAVLEEHYWLASAYMRMFKRGNIYDAYPLFYWQLKNLWNKFEIVDYTIKLLRNPDGFSVSERVDKHAWIKIIPDWILSTLRPLYPNYNWILVKEQ